MHELGIARGILDIALSAARRAGAGRVTAVDVVIGALGGGADEAVRTCFEVLSDATPAQGALLRFTIEPVAVRCWDCASSHEVVPPLPDTCEACGGSRLAVLGGRSFRVQSIEAVCPDEAIREEELCSSTS